eukprot:CAMPEP_0184855264 /NCGR_PEP_ID=MMETSP0580-20130426/565_1 /TAXON_ID=1118495 /ORGANISM="Dactyliosolen fragilissimus" /LENGTH=538 /DNA_ID=CAMNT_0027349737 /DNA_START=247 /DNA_END=1863 /DNA_ORIENTATION=+
MAKRKIVPNNKNKRKKRNEQSSKREEETIDEREKILVEQEDENSTVSSTQDLEAMERMVNNVEESSDDDDNDNDEDSFEDDFGDGSKESEEISTDEDEYENGMDVDVDADIDLDPLNDHQEESPSERTSAITVTDTMGTQQVDDAENWNLDMRNLLTTNSHQVDTIALYDKKNNKSNSQSSVVIPTIDVGGVDVNEEYLLNKAKEGCSHLLEGLWQLDTEKSDAGPVATLPTFFKERTPRALPPPEQKAETKWEKFAKERGIAPKEKRSRKVWDELTNSWTYRTGYEKAASLNDPKSWPIMEVKGNDDPFEDPWQKARDEKKKRLDKNTDNRMRNAERAGLLAKGTATRTLKAKTNVRESGRKGGNMDNHNIRERIVPAGIPIDLNNNTNTNNNRNYSNDIKSPSTDPAKRGKELTKLALYATQRSTASLGKFDSMREGEPERKKVLSKLTKRKYESSTDKTVLQNESNKNRKVLDHVLNGGGSKAKERAIRKGEYAKGETGYDYDFEDGLSGNDPYKKKKGRAGMGKMRKVTKKRAK